MKKKPVPENGLIIKYDYLWGDQRKLQQKDGSKDRPCAVIASSRIDENGDYIVILCAITHSKHEDSNSEIKLPPKVAKYIGLDDRPQWFRTNEYNQVKWSDPGIIPASADQWEYGKIPSKLYHDIKESVLGHIKSKTISKVPRK